MEEPKTQSASPLPKKEKKEEAVELEGTIVGEVLLDFYDALKEVMNGKKIFREEWEDKKYYGLLQDGKLCIHKPDEKIYTWTISDGDMAGTDWIVL